jgi:hypothetical protein
MKEGEEKGSARGSVHWSGYDATGVLQERCACVFITASCVYYSSTYYKAVRVGVLKLFPGPFGTAVSNDEIRGTF